LRLFAALPLGEEGVRDLKAYRRDLEKLGVRGNFTRPENLHITLAFLGELPEWESAAEALDTVEAEPGLLLLDRLDTFGKGGILGLCPTEDGPVRTVAEKAERALRSAGFALEKRRFRAHVTLCRELTAPAGTELPPPPAVAVPVEEMVLFLSHRPKGRLTYTPLWRKKLG
jgi:2'-5' RNA ligase